MNPFVAALNNNDQDTIMKMVMIISLEVRNNLEDFHIEHIPEKHMKEFNSLVREGVYNSLFAIANCDADDLCKYYINQQMLHIPPYWENPVLDPHYQSVYKALMETTINFKSEFLKEQLMIGNIFWVPAKKCLEIMVSVDFINVPHDDRAKHRNKISSLLRKEGYKFNDIKQGYVKEFRKMNN